MVDPVIDLWVTMQGPYIPLQARALLGFIGRYCRDRDEGTALVTEETLAKLMTLTRQQVIRLVKQLEKSKHLQVEKIPAANGYEQNFYTLGGVYTDWTITMPKAKLAQEDIWELQRRQIEDEKEKAALRAQLAEAVERLAVHEPDVTEKMLPNGSSSNKYIPITTTTMYVTKKMLRTPPENPDQPAGDEAAEIEAALQDRWHVMGQRWKGGFPVAARWYTQKGACRQKRTRENCDACSARFPDAEHPHRLEFWRQWRHAEMDAAKPPGEENSVACTRCGNGVGTGQMDPTGKCSGCVEIERLIDEEANR